MEMWLIYKRAFILLRETKYLLLLAVIAGIVVALVVNALTPPKYEARVVFRVTWDSYFVNEGALREANQREERLGQDEMETQKKIVMDRLLTREVMHKTLELVGSNRDLVDITPDQLLKKVDNTTSKGTETFQTTVEASSPELAKRLADSLAQAFIEETSTIAKADRTYIKDFLEKRFNETELQLKKARDSKEKYLVETSTVNPNDKEAELLTLNRNVELELAVHEARAVGTAAQYQKLVSGYRDKKKSFQLDQDIIIVKEMRSYIAELQVRRAYIATKFTPTNPQITSFDKAIEALQTQLTELENNPYSGYVAADIEKEVIRLNADAAGAFASARSLRERQRLILDQILKLPEQEKHYANLDDQEKILLQRRIMITNSLEQAVLNEKLRPINVRVASYAELPLMPFSPNKSRNIGVFTGVFLAIMLIYIVVREIVRQPVRTVAEAEKILGVPLLTSMLAVESGSFPKWRKLFFKEKSLSKRREL